MDNIKKRVMRESIADTSQRVEKLHIRTYDRVMRESIAARAAHKSVEYVQRIYHCVGQEEIDKLFNDLFCDITNLLEKLEG